jgi:uncharacterized protein
VVNVTLSISSDVPTVHGAAHGGPAVLTPRPSREEIRDGMRITWDVGITVRDRLMLRADIFRPVTGPPVPAILSYGIYGKGLSFQEAYSYQWQTMVAAYPEVEQGTTGKYMCWETVDPERWVPDGYAIVRVDSRGAGSSPGRLDPESPQETMDIYDCIEWLAQQEWCTGRVAMLGISYYALNQWRVAALKPPHLAAIIPWEGRFDAYRDCYFHGGIYCDFKSKWLGQQVLAVQYGNAGSGLTNRVTGAPVTGPEDLSEEELKVNRVDRVSEILAHPLYDDWQKAVTPDPAAIEVPLLSAANWGGQGLHTRGNFVGFVGAAGPKWLEVHGEAHWVHFYTDYGIDLQKRFLDYHLKRVSNGWQDQPRVQLNVRHCDGSFELRYESEWPIARTEWERLFLDAGGNSLSRHVPPIDGVVAYDARGPGVTFVLPPCDADFEITGPIAAKLFIESVTADADLFLTLRVFRPDTTEVTFQGALDPHTPIANGWLRASHRKLDITRSTEYWPFHTHDEVQPLSPGQIYELDIEIWPTSIVIDRGYRLALTVSGRDYEYPGPLGDSDFVYAGHGVGPFTHTDRRMRPEDVYGGRVTVHTGPSYPSFVLIPVIPPADGARADVPERLAL